MKTHCSHQRNQALTLLEVLVIIFLLFVIAITVLPPGHGDSRSIARRIACQNNLKQDVLAIKLWSGDQTARYPMEVSMTNGGTMELMNTSDAWRTFQVMSNELSTPKLLFCVADETRIPATNFDDSLRQHISYFININATDTDPQSIVFGDSAFEFQKSNVPSGFFDLISNTPPQWSSLRHPDRGNVAFADGSVQTLRDKDLIQTLTATGNATNHIFIP